MQGPRLLASSLDVFKQLVLVYFNPHCRVFSKTECSSLVVQHKIPSPLLSFAVMSAANTFNIQLYYNEKNLETLKKKKKRGNKNLKISTKMLTWNLLRVMFQHLRFLQKPCTLSYYIPITRSKLFSRGRRRGGSCLLCMREQGVHLGNKIPIRYPFSISK